jgi:hypothetical protein
VAFVFAYINMLYYIYRYACLNHPSIPGMKPM